MSQYIPDLTERFPEGMNGVDMTPSYFGEPISYDDYCDFLEYEPPTEPNKFEIGNQYRQVGIYGGVTIYEVKEIDRENNRILLAEMWFDVDGNGTRPAQWHKLVTDENGNEKALEWTSKEFGNIWIYA
jgi:hypothetical protein